MLKKLKWVAACLAFFACHKNEITSPAPVETADQKLVKVVRATLASADVPSVKIDSMHYSFDAAGMVVSAGSITYKRDANERIVQIAEPFASLDGGYRYTNVHYLGQTSSQVAYCTNSYSYYVAVYDKRFYDEDSTVYERDKSNAVVKIVNYWKEDGSPFRLDRFWDIGYDKQGRINEIHCIVNNLQGILVTCTDYKFDGYDDKANAIPAGDEVRLTFTPWNTGTISANNVISETILNCCEASSVKKSFEYRADGRPRTATVVYSNGSTTKEMYYYE